MKNIKLEDIKPVLDKAFANYQSGAEKNQNILFIGAAGGGKSAIIKKWIDEHNDFNSIRDYFPVYLHEIAEDGSIIPTLKDGRKQYYYDKNAFEFLNKKPGLLFFKRLNWGHGNGKVSALEGLLQERKTVTYVNGFEEMEVDNVPFIIATAYPRTHEDQVMIAQDVEDRIYPAFEIYNIID